LGRPRIGTLVVNAYPTTLFAKAADHTYVECGTGAVGWSCWGGKTGGTSVRQASGSTSRANDIAEPDERAGITCYLINGVCHQAANRILLPARITVNGVRGYALSSALYGVYGRASRWPCRAPFNQHPTTTGDLPACVIPPAIVSAPIRTDLDETDTRYLEGVLAIYQEFDRAFVTVVSAELTRRRRRPSAPGARVPRRSDSCRRTLKAGHLSMISQPDAVRKVILEAAQSVSG
jgi:hypothetical protein